jgi:hypothetical protein
MGVAAAPLPWMPEPVPPAGEWLFRAESIIGGVPLGLLRPHGFSATSKLSAFGNGQITLANEPGALDGPLLTRLWSYKIWAYYAGVPYWCGVPSGLADDGGNYVTLTLTELPGYLRKRAFDVQGGQRYSGEPQLNIARDLAAPVADVGVTVVTQGSGQPRDRSYEFLEGGQDGRAGLLANLSQVINGPEFRTEYGTGPGGQPTCTLRIAYPRVGTNTEMIALAVPGAAMAYSASWDDEQLRTRTYSVGDVPENAAEGTPKPVVIEDRPQAGMPRLDAVDDWPSTYLEATLRERAKANATIYSEPALDLKMTATVAAPPPTAYAVGDDVTVRVVSPLLEAGYETSARLTEVTVSAGEGTATWTVAIKEPHPRPRATLTQRLGGVEGMVAALHRAGRLVVLP